MDTDNGEDTDKPKTIGPVKIEWDWDFDNFWHEMKSIKAGDQEYTLGEEGRFRLKGRCRRCWGGLIGKGGAEHVPTAIRCCVCGFLLEGKDAREEYQRMSEQNSSNTFQMAFGFPSKYHDDARFVSKIFPHIDRQSAEEFHELTSAEAGKGPREGWLTRREFPGGSAGFLFLQARALMSGVERLPRELSVAHFWGFDIHDDGSATVHVPTKELSEGSQGERKRADEEARFHHDHRHDVRVRVRVGDEGDTSLPAWTKPRRIHDLWLLYSDPAGGQQSADGRGFPGSRFSC